MARVRVHEWRDLSAPVDPDDIQVIGIGDAADQIIQRLILDRAAAGALEEDRVSYASLRWRPPIDAGVVGRHVTASARVRAQPRDFHEMAVMRRAGRNAMLRAPWLVRDRCHVVVVAGLAGPVVLGVLPAVAEAAKRAGALVDVIATEVRPNIEENVERALRATAEWADVLMPKHDGRMLPADALAAALRDWLGFLVALEEWTCEGPDPNRDYSTYSAEDVEEDLERLDANARRLQKAMRLCGPSGERIEEIELIECGAGRRRR